MSNSIINGSRICLKPVRSPARALTGVPALCLVVLLASPSSLFGFVDDLEALWQDRNPVPPGGCLSFIVKAWPYHHYRGRTSPHDCLVNAIVKHRESNHEYAFGWPLGAACPDRQRQDRLLRHAPKVLEHLLTVYGPEVPSELGGRDPARAAE